VRISGSRALNILRDTSQSNLDGLCSFPTVVTGSALFLLSCLLAAADCYSQPAAQPRIGSNSVDAVAVAERLRRIVSAGTHPELHSVTFRDDRLITKKAYEAIPTEPPRVVIGHLQRGLHRGYGLSWDRRTVIAASSACP
jgi:hypothetical protein